MVLCSVLWALFIYMESKLSHIFRITVQVFSSSCITTSGIIALLDWNLYFVLNFAVLKTQQGYSLAWLYRASFPNKPGLLDELDFNLPKQNYHVWSANIWMPTRWQPKSAEYSTFLCSFLDIWNIATLPYYTSSKNGQLKSSTYKGYLIFGSPLAFILMSGIAAMIKSVFCSKSIRDMSEQDTQLKSEESSVF